MSGPIIHLEPKQEIIQSSSAAKQACHSHRRWSRSIAVWILFVNSIYIILLHSKTVHLDVNGELDISNLPIMIGKNEKIRIFYNLFIKSADDSSRVLEFVNEQLSGINSSIHEEEIFINSIGYPVSNISDVQINQHYADGGEDVTLHSIWEYCQDETKRDAKVIYLHSKGSFHPDENNNRLRRFLTEGALSEECASLPNDCNVCSSRMSPHPHPHTSGNMWLAKCSYISKLRDPYALRDGELPNEFNHDNGCRGFGRYFFEHWIYSHPSAKPCDLYIGQEYTWAYENIPNINFTKDLKKAPRFGFDVFVALLLNSYWYCREDKSFNQRDSYMENRKVNYKLLYNTTELDESWYLWDFLKK